MVHQIGMEAIVLCYEDKNDIYPHRITLLQPIKEIEVIDHRVTSPDVLVNIIMPLSGRVDKFKV